MRWQIIKSIALNVYQTFNTINISKLFDRFQKYKQMPIFFFNCVLYIFAQNCLQNVKFIYSFIYFFGVLTASRIIPSYIQSSIHPGQLLAPTNLFLLLALPRHSSRSTSFQKFSECGIKNNNFTPSICFEYQCNDGPMFVTGNWTIFVLH